MNKLTGPTARDERGFTLVELIVVMVILVVLATIVVPTIFTYISSSKERAYLADRERIQTAVDAYFAGPSNVTLVGNPQYPTLGEVRDGNPGTLTRPDADTDPDLITLDGNPLGATLGGAPKWIDDNNGVRDVIVEEILNDEDGATGEGWHVVTVSRQGTEYIVDSRDFFIDFDRLVSTGFLKEVPASASRDNSPDLDPSATSIKYAGSYSWFINSNGKVDSLLFSFPESDKTGFQTLYP